MTLIDEIDEFDEDVRLAVYERPRWWGGFAWDSFALPHLLPDGPEVPRRVPVADQPPSATDPGA